VSGLRWPTSVQIAASIVTTKKPHATAKTLFYYSQYVEKMGCMICKSKEKTSGSGMHSRTLTEDGKLIIACTTCRTRQFQDMLEISPNDKQRLHAEWKAYVTAKANVQPQPHYRYLHEKSKVHLLRSFRAATATFTKAYTRRVEIKRK